MPTWPHKRLWRTDLIVVADHDQVIDLRSLADPRGLEGRAIDRAVRPDLDVVLDFEPAGVRDLDVAAVDLAISEAITAKNACRSAPRLDRRA